MSTAFLLSLVHFIDLIPCLDGFKGNIEFDIFLSNFLFEFLELNCFFECFLLNFFNLFFVHFFRLFGHEKPYFFAL